MEDNQIKDLVDSLNRTHNDFKEYHERAEKEIKAHGKELAQTKEALEKINAKLDEKDEQLETALTEISALKAAKDAPPLDGKSEDEIKAEKTDIEYKGAYDRYLRRGNARLKDSDRTILEAKSMEVKTLTSGSDIEGGIFVPAQVSTDLIMAIDEISPIRAIANVEPTTSDRYRYPKETASFSAVWAGETETRAETAGTAFGMEEIPVNTMTAMVPVSNDLLEDSVFNLEAYLNKRFATKFAQAEGAAFVTGSAVKRPEGFTVNAAILAAYVPSLEDGAFTGDGIWDIVYDLKEGYAAGANWVLKRTSIGAIRKLKDSMGGYLWVPGQVGHGGIALAEPSTLAGYPIVAAPDMPAVASDAYAAAFGNFKAGYTIVDRRGIVIKRIEDSTTVAGNYTQFWATRRVGGGAVLVEAIKLQKLAAS